MSRNSRRNKRDLHQRSIYADLPREVHGLRLIAFGQWIADNGGTCLHTTNQYEVARWQYEGEIAVIYCKADKSITWTISSAEDYRAFLKEQQK